MKAALKLPETETAVTELLVRLRAQVAKAEARIRQRPFAVHPSLLPVLGESGLKPGAAYVLETSGSLLHALLAEPSQEGHWCGVVGLPTFAAEAAQLAGVRLDRLVLVPEPAEQWLAATAALAEVVPVLAVRPFGRVRESDAARLMSRLRDRGSVLLVVGDWPRAEARFTLTEPRWHGLGNGHGRLAGRELQVGVTSRRYPAGRSARLVLPSSNGRIAAVESAAPQLRVAG
ncbi:MAG: hypothetical protein L6256_02265 [Propionicimonas sp.]|uniref:hypothetical protein n=1 Tax=Propionicimonas sp. TaxID=1955623 RepID=UPI0025D55444|nr:hypothetical protein [Propionicimonas sp.]MCG2804260.1 hypothetical protein [Propionicimonas sp.]